jgi:hypothetical protein
MTNLTRSRFLETYAPLATQFVESIAEVKYNNIPQPFLPVCGNLYDRSEDKIAFIGMETRGWGNTTDFVEAFHRDPEGTLLTGFDEFNELEFCDWGNNFGTGFWDFNFKFLAHFHNKDWKAFKYGEEEDLLRSFVWGNTNAIERYEVTAQKRGVEHTDWMAVKKASQVFDTAAHLLDIFEPRIAVILNWAASEQWLTSELNCKFQREEIDDHFWYYFFPSTRTHVFWTAHPMWLCKNRDFDDYIKFLVDFVKERQIKVTF